MSQGFTRKIIQNITEEVAIDYQIKIDDLENGITYVGKSLPGTADSSASWQIKRIDETLSPDLEVLYADSVNTFTKVWDDRATYTYS